MRTTEQIQRVLMTADTIGGVWTYALDLSRALGQHGVEVGLATMGAPVSADQRNQLNRLPNVQLYESTYRLEWMDDPWADVERAAEWLLTIENEVDADIVHLNGYSHGDLPWRAPHLVAGHSCVLSWWRAVKNEDAPRSWDRYRSAVTRGLRSADFVIAPSGAMLTELNRHYGPFRSSGVIANGRNAAHYANGPKDPFVLAAGRVWDEAKNIAILSRVQDGIDWPIYVAGDDRHPSGDSRPLSRVVTLGQLTPAALSDFYARAAIFCSPALYEPFGLSILEAALAGCALVLSDIPSLRENWEGAALFVPPHDTAGLRNRLSELSGNGTLRRKLAAAARRRALQFTPDRMADGYLAVYQNLAHARVPEAVAGD